MSSLSTLPPDQRAVLQLLLQKDRSYDEIARLLRLDGETIRARAHVAVAALGPDTAALSDDERGQLTDFLLGEQPASARAATRAFLEGSAPARAWAGATAEELRPLGGDRLPDIPAEPASTPEPASPPEPAAEADREPPQPGAAAPIAPPAAASAAEDADWGLSDWVSAPPAEPAVAPADASATAEPSPGAEPPLAAASGVAPADAVPPRKRGARAASMLLVFAIAAVIALLIILALRGLGGDDEPDAPVASTPAPASTQSSPGAAAPPAGTATNGPADQADVSTQVSMRPAQSGDAARATATLLTQSGRRSIAIAARALEPTTDRAFYGLWFANSKQDALFLGYTPQVTSNGRMRLFDTLPSSADPSQYGEIWLTREVVEQGSATPTRPGSVVLRGAIPAGD